MKWLKLGLAPIAVYFAGFCALAAPALGRFSTHYFADGGDGFQNVWNLWWVRTALVERGTHVWFTELMQHPTGVTLLGQTMAWVNGLLSIPLRAFLTDVQTYNVIVTFASVMTGWMAFLLAHHVSGSFRGSIFAGAAFAFSGYWMSHAEGHLGLMSLWGIPLFVLSWIRFIEKPGAGRAVAASAALAAAVGCDYYYAFYAVAMGALLFPAYLARHRQEWRARGARAAGALGLFVALSLATTGALFFALYRVNRADPFQQAHQPIEWSLDVASLFIPGGHWRFADLTRGFWQILPGNIHETSVSVGWCLIVAVAFSIWAHLRKRVRGGFVWAWIGLLFGVLALGPALHVFGQRHDVTWLPYPLLERILPPLRMSGMPIRMVAVLQLCAAVLAAIGFDDFLRTVLRPWPLRVLFVAVFAVESLRDPLPATPRTFPDYAEALARLPQGAVFGLQEIDPCGTLLHQTVFRKPVTGGYTSRVPLSCVERYERMKRAFDEGRMKEFFESSQTRYVVRPNLGPGESPPEGLKRIFVGSRFSIFVATDDPLPSIDAPPGDVRDTGRAARLAMDGAGDGRLTSGWFDAERDPGGRAFRWTGRTASFELKAPAGARRVCVRALPRPRPARVLLTVDGSRPIEQTQPAGEESVLCFPISEALLPKEAILCSLESETFSPAELGGSSDDRQLGLRIAEIWIE